MELKHEGTVDIGFISECEPWKIESRLFPSKVGGKPAWLDLEQLPNVEDLKCNLCQEQLIFLCQVYAPYEEDDNNFHRTVFIFICRNGECCRSNKNDNIKVFRSQLCRINKFYPEEPPLEQPDPSFKLSEWVKLCNLCGCLAEKHCGKCKEVYCCRQHQVIDWKEGHKIQCGGDTVINKVNWKRLFHEYELLTEPEVDQEHEVDADKELEKFDKLRVEGKTGTMSDIPEADLEAHSTADVDRTFFQFRKRISQDPEQVLRYERAGKPLWISKEPRPEKIPDCEYCHGPREYEFQIMPQMLTMLKESELDWGILVVYSCKKSCFGGSGYKKEFIFKQDVSSDNAI